MASLAYVDKRLILYVADERDVLVY